MVSLVKILGYLINIFREECPSGVRHYMAELQNAEIFPVTSLRGDSTTDAFPAISKILGTLTRNICGEVSF